MKRGHNETHVPKEVKLQNGMRLILKQNHSSPIVSLCAMFLGGVRLEDACNNGISHFVQRLLMKGTRKRTALEIADELEFLGAYISPFTMKDCVGISMQSVSRQLDKGLDLFADVMLNPVFKAEEVEKERKNILADIRKIKDDTISYCLSLLEEVLFRRHPYRLPLRGTKEVLLGLERSHLVDWFNYLYTPERMVLSVVGDFKERELMQKLEYLFSDFSENRRPVCYPVTEEPADSARLYYESSSKQQVAICVGFLAPSSRGEDYFPFDVMNHVLAGMGSRLFIELRDKMGLAYAVSSSFEPRTDVGTLKAYIATSPKNQEKALKALLAELEKIAGEEVGKEELGRAKRYMLGLNRISLQKNSSQAYRYAYHELAGIGYRFLDVYPDEVKKVTSAAVKKAASAYLDTRNFSASILTPKLFQGGSGE